MLVLLKERRCRTAARWVPDRFVRASDFDGKLGQPTTPEWKTVALDERARTGAAQRRHRLPLGPDGRADAGRWNLRPKKRARQRRRSCACPREGGNAETAEVGFPYFGGESRPTSTSRPAAAGRRRSARRAGAAHPPGQGRRRALGHGRHRVRPAGGATGVDCAAWARTAQSFDDDTPHAGLAGAHHRRAARRPSRWRASSPTTPTRPRAVDGDHRRGDEPLVPLRHELPRRHQHADDVRLHRPERRRLGALRGPGEAAPADRLDGARLRARLDPPAAPAEQHQLLLRPHRPVALREAGVDEIVSPLADKARSAAA